MFKKLIWIVVLLATTAFTVLFGEDFSFPTQDVTPTSIIFETTQPTPAATATIMPVETEEPMVTEPPVILPEETTTPLPTEPTPMPTATTAPTDPVVLPTEEVITDLFSIQTGSPVFAPNFAHPAAACAWQGIGGQILDTSGLPLANYILRVSGLYNGNPISLISVTGLVTNNPYGPASFEFVLGNSAVESSNALVIQVFDAAGDPVTNPFPLQTSSACSSNLMILNFVQK